MVDCTHGSLVYEFAQLPKKVPGVNVLILQGIWRKVEFQLCSGS